MDPNRTHKGMVELSVDACLDLLGGSQLGRIAFMLDGAPQILPVNYRLHEGSIIFRTTYGTMLDTISGSRVAFEIDGFAVESQTGWSVVVRGRAEEIWLPQDLDEARLLPLSAWAPGERSHFVRVQPTSITGRRIT